MELEKKYLIKFLGEGSCPKSLYWLKDHEDWITDPHRATQFNNPEGITEVGRLLVEHEWITHLIPTDDIPKVKTPKVKTVSPPSDDFIIVVDRDGDPLEVFGGNINLDQVFQLIDKLDREPGYPPHSAWRRSAGGFTRVFERIEKEIGK